MSPHLEKCLDSSTMIKYDENQIPGHSFIDHGDVSSKIVDLRIIYEKVKMDLLALVSPSPEETKRILVWVTLEQRCLLTIIEKLCETLDIAKGQMIELEQHAHHYDSKIGGIKANGYRSFICINGIVIDKLTEFALKLQEMNHQKNGTKDKNFVRDLQYWVKYLAVLSNINAYLIELKKIVSHEKYQLFPEKLDVKSSPNLEYISKGMAMEDVTIFFDQGIGLHLHEDTRFAMQMILYIEALCSGCPLFSSESFLEAMGAQTSSFFGLRFINSSNYLAKTVASKSRQQQISFCKTIFSFTENPVFQKMTKYYSPKVCINNMIPVEPDVLIIQRKDQSVFRVPIPQSHIGNKTLNLRLISTFRTKDMPSTWIEYTKTWLPGSKMSKPSETILFHAHGGAFIAQTSKSHESYLNFWAKDTGAPILSVDYSLAPEAPYPRAVEEMFYAYCWMRNNFAKLGTTGENVIFVGDSAGGNLLTGVVLRCIKNNIPLPNSLCLCYPALVVGAFPSPSRMLSLIDPLGRFPFLLRCMNAYTDPNYTSTCPRTYEEELNASLTSINDPLLSPLLASAEILSKFPSTYIFTSTMDSCLDESIEFSNILKNLDVKIHLHVFDRLPHGFLNLHNASKECQKALDFVTSQLQILSSKNSCPS